VQTHPPRCLNGIDKDQLELIEVIHPAPGQAMTPITLRRTYGRTPEVILVDSAALDALISAASDAEITNTSAGVAPGNNDSAIARAVLTVSYTSSAARASSVRPLRPKISKRASIGSVCVNVFTGAPLGVDVVRDSHRKPKRSTHPISCILTAPQGWGKTRNAEALRIEHGCVSVVDEWHPPMPITSGALHLTNVAPHHISAGYMLGAKLVSHGWLSSEGGAA
jgi:hypothetical protein